MASNSVRLKVKEAAYQDVDRGRARISKRIMNKLGVSAGDIIEIEGPTEKKTTAVIWHAFKSDEYGLTISIDAATRSNAGVRLDDIVTVSKVSLSPAEKIILTPLSNFTISNVTGYFQKTLQDRAISIDDVLRVPYMGQNIDYKVLKIVPEREHSVYIVKTTVFEVKETPDSFSETLSKMQVVPKVSYEEIGGMEETIKKIREMVELPMRYPQLFERLGIEPPKGVLLHGPPGTGKTLLAKAVANETDAYFITVSGPEIMSKFYGESEQKIRDIFEEARQKAPSILFIDEIDSIATKRDDSSSGELERRVVSQLLALMDGLEGRGELVVIGATNRPNAIDPALRRPGRFDREIEIGVPNKDGRLVILGIHTRAMPLADEVDLELLADRTHGFVGADLASLTKEAAMRSIRRVFPQITWDEDVPAEIIEQITVLQEDFNNALAEVKPSALREVFLEIPTVTWEDVGGLDDVKHELKEIIEWPAKYPDLFNYMDAEAPRGILLIGKPGTGKTLLVRAIANEVSRNFIYVKGSEVHSKWLGESEKIIQETFRKARLGAPCIIFFDEIDALTPSRSGSGLNGGASDRIVTTLLTEMSGLEELRDVIVIAATNRPSVLDPALLRPGRFERIIELPLPDTTARENILRVLTRNKPLSKQVLLKDLAKKTEGFSGADLKGLISRATFVSINRFLQDRKEMLDGVQPDAISKLIEKYKLEIEPADVVQALDFIRPPHENH
ncbi:MAG: CDC48 family AAA ATPase [Candidatus Heimdallarchaeota archaeon]